MKNSLGRFVGEGFTPFNKSDSFRNQKRIVIAEKPTTNTNKLVSSISEVFDSLAISDGMTLSFHHHLRDGDKVLSLVAAEIKKRNLKNMILAPTSIFPCHKDLVELIENKNVVQIYTNYMNGPVADAISAGKLALPVIMMTHGGRPQAIESGYLKIDVAFIACPIADIAGNGNGFAGVNACGSLGYIISDMLYAHKKVVITDYLVEKVEKREIKSEYIDYVVKVDSIGDAQKIVSGTTKITKDPIGLKIAKEAALFLDSAGYIINGFSMQTGAGGTSLAVASFVKEIMLAKNIKASFASGGITGYYTSMLEEGLVEKLYDVQSFDLEAVKSIAKNKCHFSISASKYANPYEDNIANKLDFVILGATEVDVNFNVNVTTSSLGNIIGGSGGHADTAYGAKLTMIVTPLIKSRIPIIKEAVTTITTPGSDVDVIVTERGIAINPLRQDLIKKMKDTKLNIVTIEELLQRAHSITGIPEKIEFTDEIIGVVMYRDGTIIDTIYRK
ncbi:MAG TPA: citrate lyase subunit alpha [Bacilli bacterium]|nr:citrate lyase subunit alpha [Bacilli bacterium]